uniref:Guanylate cyclase domain-containing protein n=1 Tax=Aplanochytrium stocchinoi TaxID=215587 RepID=A0A7S3UYL5_9STRA
MAEEKEKKRKTTGSRKTTGPRAALRSSGIIPGLSKSKPGFKKKKAPGSSSRSGSGIKNNRKEQGTGRGSGIGSKKPAGSGKAEHKRKDVDQMNEIAFISNEVRAKLLQGGIPKAPSSEAGVGAVLFVDISGFTDLGKKLKSNLTPERATETLANEIFGALAKLTDICLMWGGDVAKFAGDALLCVWKVDSSPLEQGESDMVKAVDNELARIPDLNTALRLARRAAYDMLKGIKEHNADLEVHGGVGSGNLLQFHLGYNFDNTQTGMASRWHLVTGHACVEAGDLVDQSPKGSIYFITEDGDGDSDSTEKKTGEITRDTVISEETALFAQDLSEFQPPMNIDEWIEKVDPKDVLSYVPKALQNKLKGGGIIGGEILHKVSVMFIGLQHLQLSKEELESNTVELNKLHKLNDVFNTMISVVHSYGGEIRDLLFDDKGCIFIAVFGAHAGLELSALKCVRAGMAISKGISKSKIGITVGSCFTGMCGTNDRHDFVVMGDSVNNASRLSGLAEQGQILVGDSTEKATRSFIDYQSQKLAYFKRRPFTLEDGTIEKRKVKVADFDCHIVLKEVTRAASFIANFRGGSVRMQNVDDIFVGRVTARNTVVEIISGDQDRGESAVVLVTGEQGVGKTAFIREIRNIVSSFTNVVFGAGFQIEENTSCFSIRQIISSMLGIDGDPSEMESPAVLAKCQQAGVKPDKVALGHIFPNMAAGHSHASSSKSSRNILRSSTKANDGKSKRDLQRAMNTAVVSSIKTKDQKAIVNFFKSLVASSHKGNHNGIETVIIIEDIQWLDANSYEVVLDLIKEKIPKVAIILTSRSLNAIDKDAQYKLKQLLELLKKQPNAYELKLEHLSEGDTGELCAKLILDYYRATAEYKQHEKSLKVLGMQETDLVSQNIKKVVYQRTNGLPNHITLLVRWMIESKNVVFHEKSHEFDFSNEISMLQAENVVPKSVADTIVFRLNILAGDARNVLKIAAGIGSVFTIDELFKVLSHDGSKIKPGELNNILTKLKDAGFVEPFQKRERQIRMRRLPHEWTFVSDVTKQAVESLLPDLRRAQIKELVSPDSRFNSPEKRKKGLGKFFST